MIFGYWDLGFCWLDVCGLESCVVVVYEVVVVGDEVCCVVGQEGDEVCDFICLVEMIDWVFVYEEVFCFGVYVCQQWGVDEVGID